jgi:flagellin
MASVINTNMASLNAQRNLSSSQASLSTALQRLSSGLRINSAKDDAAGMAITSRMTSQINGLNQAARNANDGISLAQTAEGSLNAIGDNLQRMRELTVQAANATNSSSDRASLQSEVTSLANEIDRVARSTSFNGVSLLDGTFNTQTFQVGANATVNDQISIASITDARASSLGIYSGFSKTSVANDITNGAAANLVITPTGGGGATTVLTVATDAKSIAAAINSAGVAGLSATTNATSLVGAQTATTSAAGTSSFTLNGVTISVATSLTAATTQANALTAINAQSAATGVVATDNGAGLTLAAADGRNIVVAGFALGTSTATTIADFGITAAAAKTGTYNVQYSLPTGSTVSSIAITGAGQTAGVTGAVASTGSALSALNIANPANLAANLASIDAALSSVNVGRAFLGAVQNRFTSAVSNLMVTTENLTASRSRIQDADFAAETAAMTRGQILQQAGTAILAQANSLPNSVLSLLK